jgi:hypothetical protein
MSGAKQASKRKRQSKAVPVLGAAGLSLTLASEVSLATTAPALDTMTRNAGVSHEIILREEEIFDVSLATFYVFDKERAGAFRAGERLITFGGACCQFACLGGQSGTGFGGPSASGNNAYSPPPPTRIRPAHKHVRKKP